MADSLLGLEKLSGDLNSAAGTAKPADLAATVQEWLQESIYPLIMGAIIFVTVASVFYGGFLYFTAYGDENKATQAKKSITYGFIGLFIALSAFTIITYVRQNIVSREAEEEIYENFEAPVTEDNQTYQGGEELFEQ